MIAALCGDASLKPPMSAPVTRILSDLHYKDGHSLLQRLDALDPLLDGVDHLILNGDTLDTQASAGFPHLDEVRAYFPQRVPRVTFHSGNHDPFISEQAECSLLDERVWVTHGDVLFDSIAPWSSHRPEIERRIKTFSADVPPGELGLVATRLRLNRRACLDLPEPHDRHDHRLITRIARLAHLFVHPGRPLAMLCAWYRTPALARHLALTQRPRARMVVVGHTHFPGIWRDPSGKGPVVVNTGSFSRPFGARCVDVRGDRVEVVRVRQTGDTFRPDRVIAGFSLAP